MNREEILKEIDYTMSELKDAAVILDTVKNTLKHSRDMFFINKDDSEAYNKGLEDAWKLAQKLWLPTGYSGLEHTEVMKVFGCDYCLIAKKYTPQEALVKLEVYEKEQEEIKRKNDQRLPGRKTTTQETGKGKKGNKKK